MRLAHELADTLITPLNDSFVDLDVLANVDAENFRIAGLSHYAEVVGEALVELSQQLGFRCVEGLAERVVFREFYPRGLTAVDDLNAAILGSRPTMSHATAQLEVQGLIAALFAAPEQGGGVAEADAA